MAASVFFEANSSSKCAGLWVFPVTKNGQAGLLLACSCLQSLRNHRSNVSVPRVIGGLPAVECQAALHTDGRVIILVLLGPIKEASFSHLFDVNI